MYFDHMPCWFGLWIWALLVAFQYQGLIVHISKMALLREENERRLWHSSQGEGRFWEWFLTKWENARAVNHPAGSFWTASIFSWRNLFSVWEICCFPSPLRPNVPKWNAMTGLSWQLSTSQLIPRAVRHPVAWPAHKAIDILLADLSGASLFGRFFLEISWHPFLISATSLEPGFDVFSLGIPLYSWHLLTSDSIDKLFSWHIHFSEFLSLDIPFVDSSESWHLILLTGLSWDTFSWCLRGQVWTWFLDTEGALMQPIHSDLQRCWVAKRYEIHGTMHSGGDRTSSFGSSKTGFRRRKQQNYFDAIIKTEFQEESDQCQEEETPQNHHCNLDTTQPRKTSGNIYSCSNYTSICRRWLKRTLWHTE